MKIDLETGPGTLDIITINGVRMSLEVLKILANPDPQRLYHIKQNEGTVSLTVVELK